MLNNKTGQNAIEYMLLLTAVIIVILLALSPNGFMTNTLKRSLDISVNMIEQLPNSATFPQN